MLKKSPIQFLVWNLNEDTNVFWSDITTLEDNGFLDPWGQRINVKSAKKQYNSVGDIIEYRLTTEYQDHPFELVILNE